MPEHIKGEPHFIECPHCGYRFDISKFHVNRNTCGENFISCPRPGSGGFSPDRKKPACGQYIALDENYNVAEGPYFKKPVN